MSCATCCVSCFMSCLVLSARTSSFVLSPCFFFFHDTATTEIYTLSLHDALPISGMRGRRATSSRTRTGRARISTGSLQRDRKSTRLNSSHLGISYAVFCLKKKKKKKDQIIITAKRRRESKSTKRKSIDKCTTATT